jgi:hypothetical protein
MVGGSLACLAGAGAGGGLSSRITSDSGCAMAVGGTSEGASATGPPISRMIGPDAAASGMPVDTIRTT